MTEVAASKSLDTTSTASPLRELLSLAAPTVAQMASYTLMQFIDTWILAKAGGVTAPTAAANSGMLGFSVISLGITVFAARGIATHWPQLGPVGPWISASAYGMILGTFIVTRFVRGRI